MTFSLTCTYNCDIHEDFVEFLISRKESVLQEDEPYDHEVDDSPLLTGETVGIVVGKKMAFRKSTVLKWLQMAVI